MPLMWYNPQASSIIEAVAFDPGMEGRKSRMLVRFVGRPALYAYPDATIEDSSSILNAESPGKAFNKWKAGKRFYQIAHEDEPGPELAEPIPEPPASE